MRSLRRDLLDDSGSVRPRPEPRSGVGAGGTLSVDGTRRRPRPGVIGLDPTVLYSVESSIGGRGGEAPG